MFSGYKSPYENLPARVFFAAAFLGRGFIPIRPVRRRVSYVRAAGQELRNLKASVEADQMDRTKTGRKEPSALGGWLIG